MENQKKNNGTLVGIIIGLAIAIFAIGCLFVTGTISFKTNTTSDNEQSSKNNQTTERDTVDSALANSLYEMLGIAEGKDCLSYFISSENYKTNAKQIFGLYASYNNLNTNHYNDGSCNDECKKALSCGECSSIKKTNGNKIIKMYSLDNMQLADLPGFSDEYAYTNGIPAPICHYEIKHDTNVKYTDTTSIQIIDNQVVTDYSYDHQQINSTKNQTVTYELKKDTDGNYYLNQVIVK